MSLAATWTKSGNQKSLVRIFLSARAENTQKAYAAIWRDWNDFLDSPWRRRHKRRVMGATEADVLAFKEAMGKRAGQLARPRAPTSNPEIASPATVAHKLIVLYSFYKFLEAQGIVARNPFVTVRETFCRRVRSGDKRPTEIVPFNQVQSLIDSPPAQTKTGRRNHVFLALLFGGGLRLSEVLALVLDDISTDHLGITYLTLRRTKAQRRQEQVLPAWLAKIALDYVQERKMEGGRNQDPLLTSYRGSRKLANNEPIEARTARRLFKRLCAEFGLSGSISPHSTRATAITKLLSDGVKHREVQEFARLSSIQMVERYDKRFFGRSDSPARELSYSLGSESRKSEK